MNPETIWLMQDLEGWVSHILRGLPWAKTLEKAEQIELIRDLLQAVRDCDQILMKTLAGASHCREPSESYLQASLSAAR